MHFVEHDPDHGILRIKFSKHVTESELKRCREEIEPLLPTLKPGFRILTDFSDLEEMDVATVPDIRAMMSAFKERGVSRVIRVFPKPRKDIGLNILSLFHYGQDVDVQTVETLPEALKALEA